MPKIHLPKDWPKIVQQAMIHVIALTHYALVYSRSWAADSKLARVRLQAKVDKLECKIASLQEELRLKDHRFERIPAHRRPNYSPEERLEILELRAINGWSQVKTAKRFHLAENTISSWMKRLDEQGADGLLRIGIPVNKFPEFVHYVVQRLKLICPRLGKKRIADMLCRAGLVLATTTVGRFLKEIDEIPPDDSHKAMVETIEESTDNTETESIKERIVTAKYPNHLWHLDLTAVPIGGGFWCSWLPNALPQCWPFCWWAIAVIDPFSRRVIGFAVFRKVPNSQDVQEFLDNAIAKEGKAPKYIVSDKGSQFWCASYKGWAKDKGIKLRFGAIGKHGSIAVIERFFLSLKTESTQLINVSLNQAEFQKELAAYMTWYNFFRPHTFLNGRTPVEACYPTVAEPVNRFDPRPAYHAREADEPYQPNFKLKVSYYQGRKHLPIVELVAA